LLFVLACAFLPVAVNAVYGLDVSERVYQSNFECLMDWGYQFAVVRVYRSSGVVDTNGPGTINDAWKAGMAAVDGYIFPCYFCGDAAGQIDDTIDYLESSGVKLLKKNETRNDLIAKYGKENVGATIGMLWLDVEGLDYWSWYPSNNVQFITEMVDEANARGVTIGFYSSSSQWDPITDDTSKFSEYPIWYAHYDHSPDFDDYEAFGGWAAPAIKQYDEDGYGCGVSFDKNYYP